TAALSVGVAAGSIPAGCSPWRVSPATLANEAQLEDALSRLVEEEAEYLVVPRRTFAFLDEHPTLIRKLRESHRIVTRQQHLCELYELVPDVAEPRPANGSDAPREATASPSGLLERVSSRLPLRWSRR
ncbi:MAG TPA: hypothetical protein VF660_06460, partial [Actinomycetota bacterium]